MATSAQSIQSLSNRTSFSVLLSRYMRGQIGDSAWGKLMMIFDAENVTSSERMAYARFMNDMLADREKSLLHIPARDEATGILSDIRAKN